jgi:triosephosphate isomerase
MKSIVVANWKMNPATFREAEKLFAATKKAAEAAPSVSLILAPPSIYLRELATQYKGRRIQFAAQTIHPGAGGSFTGEISLAQVKDAKARYALVGHAERRALGETNEDTRLKVASALAQKMTPILCVGEQKRDGSGEHFTFVRDQLRAGFFDIAPTGVARVIVAYEPVWAIGADQPMPPREMHEMSIFIRKTIVEFRGQKGHNVSILYGGAIDEGNAAAMLQDGDVTGLLVGRASTDAEEFSRLLQVIEHDEAARV